MRMKVLVASVAVGMISMGANSAEIYKDEKSKLNIGGRVEVRGNISDANKEDFNDISRARLHVIGEKKLTESVKIDGKYETEIKERTGTVAGSDSTFDTRYLYAGFKTDFGNIYYGHQDNATTYLTNFSDMAEYYSGYINELNVNTSDRAKNVLRYALKRDGFTFQASGNKNGDRNSEGFGAITAYAFEGGFEFGLGYASSDETPYEGGTDEQTNTMTIVAAKYTTDNFWIGSTFQTGEISGETVKDDNFTAYDLYMGYFFENGGVFNVTYTDFSADKIERYDMNFIATEYAYYFENIAAYVSYKHNLLDEKDYGGSEWLAYENTQDEITFGLRYKF